MNLLYDFNPSPDNYINFKFYHFKFCGKNNPAISASLYLDNLANEIKNDLTKHKSVNKKSLTLTAIKTILKNKEVKPQMILLFEKKQSVAKEEINQFLDQVYVLLNPSAKPVVIIREPMAKLE